MELGVKLLVLVVVGLCMFDLFVSAGPNAGKMKGWKGMGGAGKKIMKVPKGHPKFLGGNAEGKINQKGRKPQIPWNGEQVHPPMQTEQDWGKQGFPIMDGAREGKQQFMTMSDKMKIMKVISKVKKGGQPSFQAGQKGGKNKPSMKAGQPPQDGYGGYSPLPTQGGRKNSRYPQKQGGQGRKGYARKQKGQEGYGGNNYFLPKQAGHDQPGYPQKQGGYDTQGYAPKRKGQGRQNHPPKQRGHGRNGFLGKQGDDGKPGQLSTQEGHGIHGVHGYGSKQPGRKTHVCSCRADTCTDIKPPAAEVGNLVCDYHRDTGCTVCIRLMSADADPEISRCCSLPRLAEDLQSDHPSLFDDEFPATIAGHDTSQMKCKVYNDDGTAHGTTVSLLDLGGACPVHPQFRDRKFLAEFFKEKECRVTLKGKACEEKVAGPGNPVNDIATGVEEAFDGILGKK